MKIIDFISIELENARGKIRMGGADADVWKIQQISGLGMINKNRNTIQYAGENGQHVLSVARSARTITITADIKNNGGIQSEITKAHRIFDADEVTVRIRLNNKKRKTIGSVTAFELSERSSYAQTCALQIVCDDPYFEDFVNAELSVFKQTNLLKTTFALPCAFSSRITETDVIVNGDSKTMPQILIHCSALTENTPNGTGFTIKNTLPDGAVQSIDFPETIFDAGEKIVIDFSNRHVTSSIHGNIISQLGQNSYLRDFYFMPGKNHIEIENRNTNAEITVMCLYTNKYCEAVY